MRNYIQSAFADCSSITVGPLCPATESNFTLQRTGLEPIWLASGTTDNTPSSVATVQTLRVVPAGNCPTFSSAVSLTARVTGKPNKTDDGTLEFAGNGDSKKRSVYYDSEAPNSASRRDSLTYSPSNTYAEGAEVSVRRKVQSNQSISDGTYSFQVCGVATGRPEQCVPMTLQVGGTPPVGNQPSGTTVNPQFEEF
jgi:hypothetical protein